jgi:hypothetical protein
MDPIMAAVVVAVVVDLAILKLTDHMDQLL